MSPQTATSLEQRVGELFRLIDAMDTRAILDMCTDDVQGIDEISRGWMRGRAALESYFGQLQQMVDEVRSTPSDTNTTEWGDTGVVTCVVDQTYTMNGEQQKITAPTSIVFRRESGDWKIAVFHSAPLPEEPAG